MQIIAFKSQKTSKKMEFFGIANNFELSSLILDIKSCHKMAVVLKNQHVKKSTFLHIYKRSVLSKYVFFSKFARRMLCNYLELSSETETTVRVDIYKQNETNFVFLHAVLSEILKAEKKYCSIDFSAFSVLCLIGI